MRRGTKDEALHDDGEPRRGFVLGGLAATAIVTVVIFTLLTIRLTSAPRQPRSADLPSPDGLEVNALATRRPDARGDPASPAALPVPDGGWPQAPRSLNRMDAVPDGIVIRGSLDAEGDDDEAPADEVFVSAFYIDRFEVTNDQYAECVEAGICQPPLDLDPNRFGSPRQPVVGVSWYDAVTFCQWAGKRLPTEAEWERAARGDDRRTYPWGDSPPECDQAVLTQCDRYGPDEVGARARGAGPFGTRDLAGNVWEWVQDWYAPRYAPVGPEGNPAGPPVGQQRVLRGGSWHFGPPYARVSNRHRDDPRHRTSSYGFRCAYRQPAPAPEAGPPATGAHAATADAGPDADLARTVTLHDGHEPQEHAAPPQEGPPDADTIDF